MRTCVSVRVCCVRVRVHVHVHVCARARVCVRVRVRVHVRVRACVCMCACARARTSMRAFSLDIGGPRGTHDACARRTPSDDPLDTGVMSMKGGPRGRRTPRAAAPLSDRGRHDELHIHHTALIRY